MKEKLKRLREKYLPYDELTLRRLALATTVMFSWILVWALVFKLGSERILIQNYTNLSQLTWRERLLWDLVPFNYRGEGEYKFKIIMDTVLNCFVFAPLGVTLCYTFKRVNVWRNAAICLAFSVGVELLQFITVLGNPATEDLITNTVGCFIGFGLYHLIFKRISVKSSVRTLAVINFLLAAASIFAAITLISSGETIIKIVSRTL